MGDAMIRDGVLYIMLAGNLESNFNKIEVFIDAREEVRTHCETITPTSTSTV